MLEARDILGGRVVGRILDVATGSGGFVDFLLSGLGGFEQIVAIDTSTRSEEAFRATFASRANIRFERMDATRLDFPDGCFDMVCLSNSLHHLADESAALREMRRVLRRGGTLILAEMYRDGQSETQMTHVLLHHWWASIDRLEGIEHRETYTRKRIVATVEALELADTVWFDLSDPGADAHDPSLRAELEPVIDRYQQRAALRPELQRQGERLRTRLRTVGFHSATTLFALAEKP